MFEEPRSRAGGKRAVAELAETPELAAFSAEARS